MKKSIAKRWVEKLRSGEYQQASGTLRSVNENGKIIGYCCLGVLCEVAREDGLGDWYSDNTFASEDGKNMGSGYLPTFLHEAYSISVPEHEAGLSAANVQVNYNGTSMLSLLNDQGISFEVIAQAIEETFIND